MSAAVSVDPVKVRLTVLSNSELRTWRLCARRHLYQYRQLRRPKKTHAALAFGTLWHLGMEHWWAATGDERLPAGLTAMRSSPGVDAFALAVCEVLLIAYTALYGDQTLRTICVEQRFEVSDQGGKRRRKRLGPPDEHVVMLGLELPRTSGSRGAQPPFDAVALRRIAGFFGHGVTEPRQFCRAVDCLQRKTRAPGAIAPGGPEKLGPFGEPSEALADFGPGRHRPSNLRPRASCGRRRGGGSG